MRNILARFIAVILLCAGLFCIAQAPAQVPVTGAGLGAPGGSASPAYAFQYGGNTSNSGGDSVTFSGLNLGSGSPLCILGVVVQSGDSALSSVTVNGGSMTLVSAGAGAGGQQIWYGSCTVTGSDTVVITATGDISYLEVDLFVWTATNLVSNTPVSSAEGHGSTFTSAASIGNFVFGVLTGAAQIVIFSPYSPQTPARYSTTGIFGGSADWTANASGVSGGNFTVGNGTGTGDVAIAVWH